MGSILSKIDDNTKEYHRLCKKFQEPALSEGPYGAHAESLERRDRNEDLRKKLEASKLLSSDEIASILATRQEKEAEEQRTKAFEVKRNQVRHRARDLYDRLKEIVQEPGWLQQSKTFQQSVLDTSEKVSAMLALLP